MVPGFRRDAGFEKQHSEMSETANSESIPVANHVFVLILQHPHEKREPLATAPATVVTLQHAKLVTGLSWPNLARALGHDADPRRCSPHSGR